MVCFSLVSSTGGIGVPGFGRQGGGGDQTTGILLFGSSSATAMSPPTSCVDPGGCIGVRRCSSSLATVSVCRGWRSLLHRVGVCLVADLAFSSDDVAWTRRIRGPSCTGLSPGRRATARCAPPVTVDALFGSQSFDAMVRRRHFGKWFLASLSPACAPAAMEIGSRRWPSSAIHPLRDLDAIFFFPGCFLLLCLGFCALWCVPVCSTCDVSWLFI